jgi:hypothetical protein
MFAAGAAATAVMAGASRAIPPHVIRKLTDLLAALVAPPGSRVGTVVAYGAQLINGGVFAIGYADAFRRAGRPLGPGRGFALGLLHGAGAGLLLGGTAAVHPRVPDEMPAPGLFMRRHGRDAALALVALHGLYGALVGAAAAVLRHRASHSEGV